MTWKDLLLLLQNMNVTQHTSLDSPVCMIVDGVIYRTDIIESLTSGEAYLIPEVVDMEEDDAE